MSNGNVQADPSYLNANVYTYERYKFNRTFSGTDTLAFIMLPGCSPVVIGSLTTISYSMLRNKRPVINIGRTHINGVTRGSRVFAGTMIFTLINQHWLREIQEMEVKNGNDDWIGNISDLKVDELPLFDIMIMSANEYGACCEMYIFGIDFTDEAQTISVEDLFTENVFQFIARDVSTFNAHWTNSLKPVGGKSNTDLSMLNIIGDRFYVLPQSATTIDDIVEYSRKYADTKKRIQESIKARNREKKLSRILHESSSRYFIGNDVLEIQTLLNRLYNEDIPNEFSDGTHLYEIELNGIFDSATGALVRQYQLDKGVNPTGIVDQRLYVSLLNDATISSVETERLAVCINKSGSYVYKEARLFSPIVDTVSYKETVRAYNKVAVVYNDVTYRFYQTNQGYVPEEDFFSSYYTSNTYELPKVEYNDNNIYSTIVKQALQEIYHYTSPTDGINNIDVEYIKKFQRENNLPETGIVSHEEWILLEVELGNIKSNFSNDSFKIIFTRPPGEYTITHNQIGTFLGNFVAHIYCSNIINIKITAISKYEDENYKTYFNTFTVHNDDEFNLTSCNSAFVYDPNHKLPEKVEVIIYPYNKMPYKWIFNCVEEGDV